MSVNITTDSEGNETTIEMTRGDTFSARIDMFYDDGTAYEPEEGDVIRFAVKTPVMTMGNKEYKDQTPLIRKIIPTNTQVLELLPSDTKNLHFGNYVYDVEITYASGIVDTFISGASLILMPEVD